MQHVAGSALRSRTAHLAARLVGVVVLVASLALVAAPAAVAVGAAGSVPVARGSVPTTAWTAHAPESCTCHGDFVSQWKQTMHAKAWADPFYQYARTEAIKDMTAAGVPTATADDFCTGCHAPAALMSGAVDQASSTPAINGITCGFCHQVTGITASDSEVGNVSLGFPATGPDGTRRAQLSNPQAPHAAAEEPAFATSEYCGSCHNVDHPVNGLHLETTYTEWAESSYAADGVECQNCHMSNAAGERAPYTGSTAGGAARENLFAMTFVGANVGQGNAELNEALLTSAATVSVDAPDILPAGQSAEVTVTVANTGTGHSIPTGVSEIRKVWLEVYAQAANGTKTELAKTYFGVTIKDAQGVEGGWDFWNATEIVADNRIKAGESAVQTVSVTMPAGAESQEVVAVLRYQSAADDVAAEADVANPVTDMASDNAPIYSSEEARANAVPIEADGTFLDPGLVAGVLTGAVTLAIAFIVANVLIRRNRTRAEAEAEADAAEGKE